MATMAPGMIMGNPARLDPGVLAKTVTVKGASRIRYGCIPMAVDSQHMIRGQVITAKDRRLGPYREAKGSFFCLHSRCQGEKGPIPHESAEKLIAAHPGPDIMARDREIHVYGFWSEQAVDTMPVEGCKECDLSTKAATKEAATGEQVPRACKRHTGVVGLLTPDDPFS